MEKESLHAEANLGHAEENLEAEVRKDTNDLSKPENDIVLKLEKEASFSSFSSSSDASSDEDFFQLDPADLNRSIAEKDEVSDKESARSEVQIIDLSTKNDSTTSTPGSDNLVALGAKQSPQIQSMGRSDGPEPSRLPSSIFRSKSTNPVEWSVTSNESLFSIHIERSGDLTNYYGSHLDFSPITPLVVTNSPQGPIPQPDLKQPGTAQAANAEAMKDVLRAAAEEHNGKSKPAVVDIRHSDSTSGLSDGSVRSFAFPILTGEGRNGSLKGESVRRPAQEEQTQDPPLQKQPSKAVPDAAEQSWFSCFSSCPFCR
ncbi:uncharacterized protein LOC109717903 isoform X1 [Ananas comosus]|uniref:Uncharacterized protein LOC109717903 isoform X1 n=1 Tax=Ananas comosus TaxID=4615 RepID=A0A6P5G2D4_ANACO|nr:uncharacterized protein LOC109717903 isoform X1 [Ananas comosus]XP_020099445.1 uncharacterized protein LOC109717903 isoform X1 [Ananas comosus]XP_020099446.1 uncharacterized protein LOC109717903 isoform X1 [Ananas comosus]XP_020099447.1 uncharacterized protein LOC109717903 isoform X1 [Ananas comosus]